jgi:hypothetical protein
MNDRRRYRLNVAECLSAASTCHPHYRGHLLCIAACWLALARQEETIRDLFMSWASRLLPLKRLQMPSCRDSGYEMREIRIQKARCWPRSHVRVIVPGHAAFDQRAPQPVSQATTGAGLISSVLH